MRIGILDSQLFLVIRRKIGYALTFILSFLFLSYFWSSSCTCSVLSVLSVLSGLSVLIDEIRAYIAQIMVDSKCFLL